MITIQITIIEDVGGVCINYKAQGDATQAEEDMATLVRQALDLQFDKMFKGEKVENN